MELLGRAITGYAHRRDFIVLSAAATLAACSKAPASAPIGDEASLGSPNARIKFVEYASVGCPVCGSWYRDVFPAFRKKYIDTGVVLYTLREMLVGDSSEQAMAAAGFLLARCAGRDKYFSVVDSIFKNQADIFNDPRPGLLKIAEANGLNESGFEACINNAGSLQALNARVERYVQNDHINSTPTFVINGKQMQPGYQPLPILDAAIAAARS